MKFYGWNLDIFAKMVENWVQWCKASDQYTFFCEKRLRNILSGLPELLIKNYHYIYSKQIWISSPLQAPIFISKRGILCENVSWIVFLYFSTWFDRKHYTHLDYYYSHWMMMKRVETWKVQRDFYVKYNILFIAF